MYSVVLIDTDPLRAMDLYIRMEDEGFEVFGPIASKNEGFRCLNEHNISGVVMDAAKTQKAFPELYNVLEASNLPIAFLDGSSDFRKYRRENGIAFNEGQPISELKLFFEEHACILECW